MWGARGQVKRTHRQQVHGLFVHVKACGLPEHAELHHDAESAVEDAHGHEPIYHRRLAQDAAWFRLLAKSGGERGIFGEKASANPTVEQVA